MIICIICRPDFQHWDWLDSCMGLMAAHPRVSDKMKLRNTPEYLYSVADPQLFCTNPDPNPDSAHSSVVFKKLTKIEVFFQSFHVTQIITDLDPDPGGPKNYLRVLYCICQNCTGTIRSYTVFS
jgi:hypothetical protein